jgi:hypothetical protein
MHARSIAVVNVSVCVFPPVLLPGIYHYAYATPFYNVQQTVRSIIFGTRNQSAFPLPTYLIVQQEFDAAGIGFTQLGSTLEHKSSGHSSRGAR